MNIRLGYADVIRLFQVDDPTDFAPGLELRDEGVFVASRDDVPASARGGEEEAVLTAHPTGNLAEPVLAFPCSLDKLEAFMERYGLRGTIDCFHMAEVLEAKAWALARAEAKEMRQYYWPIVADLYGLREKIKREHAAEDNDAKKVVLREVLDELNALLPDHDKPPNFTGWPWGEYENTNLRKYLVPAVAQFWEPANAAKPKDAPSNSMVATWLVKQGATSTMGMKIASIIRADWARTGRRSKEE